MNSKKLILLLGCLINLDIFAFTFSRPKIRIDLRREALCGEFSVSLNICGSIDCYHCGDLTLYVSSYAPVVQQNFIKDFISEVLAQAGLDEAVVKLLDFSQLNFEGGMAQIFDMYPCLESVKLKNGTIIIRD
ncbi:MAG: hypothetical protein UR26_C0003G0077 [candidate division TM6 bacterium GW2011_GWF2_32_72]|nr:MAG: hypothetical protein UR26_C0003G0077 [candidate division TM6 bacterium GW2011_GWF2_32_72]